MSKKTCLYPIGTKIYGLSSMRASNLLPLGEIIQRRF
jgi:hypothetical protein